MTPLLQVRLSAGYRAKPDVLRDLTFEISSGEALGLIGESGSGKSTVALAILRLLDHRGGHVAGELRFEDRDLMTLKPAALRALRGRDIGLVLQSASSSLNPALRIGTQLAEAWKAHRKDAPGLWREAVTEIFERVSLPASNDFLRRYPREISVGQAQRVLIAMAVLHRPKLLIADEPTSALDAISQSEVLALLRQLRQDLNMALLFISHDLGCVAALCDRVAILRHGEIVETGPCQRILRDPRHEYTRALLQAVPGRTAWCNSGYAVSSSAIE